jgi:multidrug efflux pump
MNHAAADLKTRNESAFQRRGIIAAMPPGIDVMVAADKSVSIRASVQDTELTLTLAIGLVTLTVFLFLRDIRATLVPAVAVPLSIIGTFGVMYLAGFSLNILSLMALTIATGFVVDDAIVVLENISRHVEAGMAPREAAFVGAREVGFTVISISISLIAVFIPILLMGGLLGRLFRQFAMTLSFAVLVSLVLSLTLTPMMCALLLKPRSSRVRLQRRRFDPFSAILRGYGRTLGWALRNGGVVMLLLFGTICLNVVLFSIIPKGFLPQQDNSRVEGGIQGDQSISFQSMRDKLKTLQDIVQTDPAVENVIGYTGGKETNSGQSILALKPKADRDVTADGVIDRLRKKLSQGDAHPTRNINTRCKAITRTTSTPSRRNWSRPYAAAPFSPTSIPTSSKAGSQPISLSIATRPHASA